MSRSRISAVPHPAGRIVRGHAVHAIDARQGIEIPLDDARELLVHLSNEGPSPATMTIRGGDRVLSSHGNGEDEHIQVASLQDRFVGPIDTAAFTQQGRLLWLDFSPETVGRISVYRLH